MTPLLDSFKTLPWESQNKSHSDVGAMERHREYYMGEGGDFPRVQAVVSLMSLESHVACPSTKGVPESELTNLLKATATYYHGLLLCV
jgi:hypothetical protein